MATRSHFRLVRAVTLLLLACPAAQAAEPSEEVRRAFDRAATDVGRPYVVGRTLLESYGRDLLPLLREQAKSADHRQRDLARILLLKIEHPRRFEAVQQALERGLAPGEAGKFKIVFAQGEELPLDRAAIPAVVDYLRATADRSGTGPHEQGWSRALQVLADLADPDYAPTLLDCFHRQWRADNLVEDALVKLGAAALPALRQAIQDAPTKQPEKGESPSARAAGWRSMQRSCLAAKTLARLNDQDGVPLLIEKLKASQYREQQSAFAHALGRLGQRRAVPALFDLLLGALRGGWDGRRYEGIEYHDARTALLRLGAAAKDHLTEEGRDSQPLDCRVLARGLAFELDHPQPCAALYEAIGRALPPKAVDSLLYRAGIEQPKARDGAAQPDIQPEEYAAAGRQWFWAGGEGASLVGNPLPDEQFQPALDLLVERALKFADPDDLERLARLRKPAWAFEVLLEILARPYARHRGEAAVRAMAIWGDRRAADELRKLVRQRDKVQPEVIVEAALALGDPAALEILEEVLSAAKTEPRLREAAELAEAAAAALKGDRPALVKLLEHPRPALRQAAAWRLLRQGDTAGVGTLIGELVRAPAQLHVRMRNDLVREGKPVLDALKQHAQKAASPAERITAEAVALRIAQPELATKFDRAIQYRSRGFFSRAGPRLADYQATGKEIAARAGKESIPLLEAEVVCGSGWGNGMVAAFALAVFQQKSSMELLVGALRDLKRQDRDRGLLAYAIRDFGEEGIAAIKDIPAPDPDRPEFQSRAGRFRGATGALVAVDPKTAAQNVVKGLKALSAESVKKDSGWADRVRGFLRIAEQVEDPAIIEPILEVLKHDRPNLEGYAFRPLSRFEDLRLVQPALEVVLNRGSQWPYSEALLTLVRQWKDQTAPRLVEQLQQSKDATRRAHAIEALAGLIDNGAPWYAIYRENRQKVDPRETEARKASCAVAIDPLLSALDDADPGVQLAAAKAFPRMRQQLDLRVDDRPVRRLLAWLPKAPAPEIPLETVDFLVWTRRAEVKPALVAAFRQRGAKDRSILSGFALGGWDWADTAPAVCEGLKKAAEEKPASDLAPICLHVLDQLGPEGWARLHEIVKDPQMPLGVRFDAARELAGQPSFPRAYPKAYDDVLALRDELSKAGPDDPRLKTIRLYNAPRDDMAARYRYAVEGLTLSAAALDPQCGYPMLMKLFPTLDEGDYRQLVIHVIEQLQRQHPGLKVDGPAPPP